jgi:hypothetical protein
VDVHDTLIKPAWSGPNDQRKDRAAAAELDLKKVAPGFDYGVVN